jgi:pimeloyl-ACP methyl ester carboxylesterase
MTDRLVTHRLALSWIIPLLPAVCIAAILWTEAFAQVRPRDSADADTAGRLAPELVEIEAGDGSGRKLLVNLLRPSGNGPFRLAIVNHGSPPSRDERAEMAVPTFPVLSRLLLKRGLAVAMPLRRGYGVVGGRWDETSGPCEQPDYVHAGLETARDITVVLTALRQRPFVQQDKVLVFGQSAGGWGALALASQNPKGVAGHVNFAGGRGGHRNETPNANCSPDALVSAAGHFGRTARQPSLWLYSENDSYFDPALARRMHDAFTRAGGKAEFHLLPPIGDDGHRMVSRRDGAAVWGPLVARFMAGL